MYGSFLIAAMLAAANASADTPVAAVCAPPPAPVVAYLAQHPAFHIVDLPDLRPEDVDYWSQENPNQCPGFVDFDADGSKHASYGLLLIARHDTRVFQELVVLRAGADGYTPHLVHAPMHVKFPDMIERADPDIYHGFPFDDTPETLNLTHEGVIYIHPESSSSVVYLKDGQFTELFTQD